MANMWVGKNRRIGFPRATAAAEGMREEGKKA
jgi:hypothetical protein